MPHLAGTLTWSDAARELAVDDFAKTAEMQHKTVCANQMLAVFVTQEFTPINKGAMNHRLKVPANVLTWCRRALLLLLMLLRADNARNGKDVALCLALSLWAATIWSQRCHSPAYTSAVTHRPTLTSLH